jgi:hypothetical protein
MLTASARPRRGIVPLVLISLALANPNRPVELDLPPARKLR